MLMLALIFHQFHNYINRRVSATNLLLPPPHQPIIKHATWHTLPDNRTEQATLLLHQLLTAIKDEGISTLAFRHFKHH